MSRQRPYENFEVAFYSLLRKKNISLNPLIEEIEGFIEIKQDMKLPYRSDYPKEMIIFWQLLSYVWGDQDENVWDSIVPYLNLDMMLFSIKAGSKYADY